MKNDQDIDERPLASIIIPSYNRRNLLPHAVESCLNQVWENCEILIIDDGSTDGTDALVAEMQSTAWPRGQVHYIRQPNRGASAARNRGLQVARGDYVQFLDSDDVVMPTKIVKQIRELEKTENWSAVCCYCCGTMGISMEKDSPKSEIGLRTLHDPLALAKKLASKIVHGMPTPSPLWRRDFLMKQGGWREDISLGDDLEYHIRLLASAEKLCFVDEDLFFVREHLGDRLSTGVMSAASLESQIRTRRSIYSTLEKAGLWDVSTQQVFLCAMRTIYANALQLNDQAMICDLEEWLWTLADSPQRNQQFHALILLRHALGRRFLLGAHKLIKNLRIA